MRRLLYCLLGSTLLHGALLWVPFPMSAGGAVDNNLQLLRVRLVEAPRSKVAKPVAEPPGRVERPTRTRSVRTRKPPPAPEPRQAATRPPVTVVKTPSLTPETANVAPVRTSPEPERKAVARGAEPTKPVANANAAQTIRRAGPDGLTDKRRDEEGHNSNAATEVPRKRNIARGTSSGEDVKATAGFTPVRYARTVKPRYPRKARRAGWEGTTVLKVLVTPDGAPGRVTVDRTSGFDVLDTAAVKAVQRWRFHPARRGMDDLSRWVRIPVAFKLKEDNQ